MSKPGGRVEDGQTSSSAGAGRGGGKGGGGGGNVQRLDGKLEAQQQETLRHLQNAVALTEASKEMGAETAECVGGRGGEGRASFALPHAAFCS